MPYQASMDFRSKGSEILLSPPTLSNSFLLQTTDQQQAFVEKFLRQSWKQCSHLVNSFRFWEKEAKNLDATVWKHWMAGNKTLISQLLYMLSFCNTATHVFFLNQTYKWTREGRLERGTITHILYRICCSMRAGSVVTYISDFCRTWGLLWKTFVVSKQRVWQ